MKARFVVNEVRRFAGDKRPMMILGTYYPDVSLDGTESEELADALVDIANGDVPDDFSPDRDELALLADEPFAPGTIVDVTIEPAAEDRASG